uniref:Uncharacterized protein n=1 Tax=Tanacetum cinerariifolium TaxID=118510 RepID=A0A6L2MXP6_TANCI|nr:hypothetical protein [Tanacetum cinerariifolium]
MQTSFLEDISEGGGENVSSPKSNEALPTTAAIAAGGAEDSVALIDLSLKLDRCINRVTTLENELGVTKKVLGGAVLKLVSRVKRLEGILKHRKRSMVLSDSEGEEAATKEPKIDLDALHELDSTSLGGDTTVEAAYTIFKASQDAHASLDAIEDTIPAGDGIPADAQTIPAGSTPISTTGGVSAGSSMDPAGQAAAAAPSSYIILAADKGKAPMVDDSILADILTEQEQVLKNLHAYQLGEDLAKKLQAEQEAEFARQQEELAQKAQAESVASPAAQGTGLSAQRRRELDAAQLIYTKADWLELMAKIATNSALSKQLLGDNVNEDNMNERLGMLLMRKRRELAEQSRVPASVPAAPSIAADVSVSAVSTTTTDVSVSEWPIPTSGSVGVSTGVTEATTTSILILRHLPLLLRYLTLLLLESLWMLPLTVRHKQIAKKRVTPIVDVADVDLIKFDSASESDGDPSPYAPFAGWHGLEVPKMLVGGDLTIAEQLVRFIKADLLNAQSTV